MPTIRFPSAGTINGPESKGEPEEKNVKGTIVDCVSDRIWILAPNVSVAVTSKVDPPSRLINSTKSMPSIPVLDKLPRTVSVPIGKTVGFLDDLENSPNTLSSTFPAIPAPPHAPSQPNAPSQVR